ncbi:MAG: hypothetical protein R2695_10150 [Acidimicrobiales bacterium]
MDAVEVARSEPHRRIDWLDGLAVVVEPQTSTVVGSDTATVLGDGTLSMRRSGSGLDDGRTSRTLDPVQGQVLWACLVAIRGAGAHRAHRAQHVGARAGDLSAGVFDAEGRMIAQAVTVRRAT